MRAEGSDTSGSLPDDGRARTVSSRPGARPGGNDAGSDDVRPMGRLPATAALRRPGSRRDGPTLRTAIAPGGRPHRRSGRRRDPALDGPRRGPPVHRRPVAGLPAGAAGPLAGSTRHAAHAGDPARVRRGDPRLRRVPQPDHHALDRRAGALHRGPARAGPTTAVAARPPVGDLRPAPAPGGHPRMDRLDDRRGRPGRHDAAADRLLGLPARSSRAPAASSARSSATSSCRSGSSTSSRTGSP